jgi:hypothetical protein
MRLFISILLAFSVIKLCFASESNNKDASNSLIIAQSREAMERWKADNIATCSRLYTGKQIRRTTMGGAGLVIYEVAGRDSENGLVTVRNTSSGRSIEITCNEANSYK